MGEALAVCEMKLAAKDGQVETLETRLSELCRDKDQYGGPLDTMQHAVRPGAWYSFRYEDDSFYSSGFSDYSLDLCRGAGRKGRFWR